MADPWHQGAPSTLGGRHPVPLAPPTSRGRFKQQIRRITSTGGSHPPPPPSRLLSWFPVLPRRGSCGTVHPVTAPDLYPTVAAPVALVHLVAVALSSGKGILSDTGFVVDSGERSPRSTRYECTWAGRWCLCLSGSTFSPSLF